MTTTDRRPPASRARRLPLLSAALLVLLAGLGAFAVSFFFTAPTGAPLPLDEALVRLDSAEGQRLLAESRSADHQHLSDAFQAQERRAWCGVASSATVLTALGTPTDQPGVFTDAAEAVRPSWRASVTGMTLSQLAGILSAHGLRASAHHADAGQVEDFRHDASVNLTRPGDYVLINYHRHGLSQEGAGHISPVSAYHAGSDRFLVMDVAAHKYPPVWVETDRLWSAMDTTDNDAGRSRGWLTVSR